MQEILKKIQVIIENTNVHHYFITTSKNFAVAKSNLINIQGFKSFVLLKDNMTPLEALALKKNLFEQMQQNQDSIFFTKYHIDKRNARMYPSLCGVDKNSNDKIALGIAWY